MRLSDCDIFRVPAGPGALHVERYGFGGPPVVLLHGFGTSSFLWRRVAPDLAVSGHSVFAFDLFGHGASDRPFDADFGIRAQSLYLRRAMSTLGIVRPTVVGCDLGAVIALRIAFDQPEFAGRLLLISPVSIQDLPGAQIRLMQRETALHVLQLVRGLFGAEPLIRSLLEGGVVDPTTLSPRLVARFVAPYLGRDGVNHLLTLTRALEDEDLSDVSLSTIKQPVLVLRGDADRWCTPAHVRKLVESLPNARPKVVPNAGRLVVEEVPVAVVDAIEALVGAQEGVSQ